VRAKRENNSRGNCLRSIAFPSCGIFWIFNNPQWTGFAFERPEIVPETPLPSPATLSLLRERVAPLLAQIYPRFAQDVFGIPLGCSSSERGGRRGCAVDAEG
jgi:hypothetical protein